MTTSRGTPLINALSKGLFWKKTSGAIYILTNPSFSDCVKIGYADNVAKRVKQLNRSECTQFGFRIYATYEVPVRLTDMKLHSIIDRLNSELRSIDNIDGKKRVREFYNMSKEDAFANLRRHRRDRRQEGIPASLGEN